MITKYMLSSAAVLCLFGGVARSEEQPTVDPRGAVLCSYAITAALREMASVCLASDKDLTSVLDYGVDQHRAFVLRNSTSTASDLDVFEEEHGDLHDATCEDLAADGWMEWLDNIAAASAEFRSEIDELLATDREPVWNPCL
ncbi:hypothetical protein M3P21_00810 [Ruegeria sp. 2012CJ41-6]|uniref:Lysozyme inhibitor LprI N-terminal domain-containing protein n=1 Tax=Ruegeria spongiae TaxID=2942209 RepID=A0ABT0PWS5_9RHOB|nr:hypothetical protein [Ruegeria spongiae]MCL6282056.1 hypothetical protein [Ruegeria spongiae]